VIQSATTSMTTAPLAPPAPGWLQVALAYSTTPQAIQWGNILGSAGVSAVTGVNLAQRLLASADPDIASFTQPSGAGFLVQLLLPPAGAS
jgi:hypothetical protein